jgi:Legume lectin domain/Chitobiase/beta-hexosaminidase C-terminal domain
MTFRSSFNTFAKLILDFANARPSRLPISTIPRNVVLLVFAALLVSLPSFAQTSILTQHYDTARTGQNTGETVLNPTNVNSTTFGKLFTLTVDGYVYAQPLYVPALVIPGNGTHNVLYVATEHDGLYAFDADTGSQLWYVTFLINGATTVSTADVGNTQDINPEMGITGTPTIDPTTNTLYVVVNTVESSNIIYRLHAIDITTGAEKLGGPVLMTASVPGTAPDGNGTTVPFNPQWANQRPGLLLLNGFVYVGFSSHGDNGPWHGWIFGFNKTTLAQTGVWCTSPNGKGNGIWGAGSGLAADAAGNIYVSTGNGDYTVETPAPPPSTTIDFGDSIVRVGLTNGVPVPTDYFTPWNQGPLDNADEDLGSGGVLVLPDQTSGAFEHILIQSGKQGEVYVVNRDKMTSDGSHYCNGCTSDPEIIQSISSGAGLWSMPAYWNGQIYLWGNGGNLEAYSLTNGMLSVSPTSKSAETSQFPGSTPVVSSNGTTNGIVWAVESDAYTSSGPAILRAYNATNVSNLLYGSNLTSGRDTLGPAVKFVVPVVTNGKVYVGTQKQVNVFGLLSGESEAVAPVFSPVGGSYNPGVQVTMGSSTPNASIYYTTDGSTPTSGSNQYSGLLTVTETTTFNAIAISEGFVQSPVSTATYIIMDQASPPNVSPSAGTYTSAQSVQLSDTSPTPTIYYTTDGTMPTHSSKQFTTAISVPSTTTITAIASSPGLNDSPAVTATFTISPNATTINFGMGFSIPGCMRFNGSTDLDDSRLQLTNGGENEAGSAFCTTPVNITNFTTDFTFQLSDAMADGITFTIQNSSAGASALGPTGGGLGYGPDAPGGPAGISNSVAVKYDLYNNAGEGEDSTGLYANGASPTVPATDMTSSGVILNSGDTMAVHITYDGANLVMSITDSSVNKTFTTSWPINIPQTIGGNTAFVGFTGGTGGLTASQKIETWTFAYIPPAQWVIQSTAVSPNATPYTTVVPGSTAPLGEQSLFIIFDTSAPSVVATLGSPDVLSSTNSLDSTDGGFGIPPGSITFKNWCDPNNPLIVNIVEEDSTTQTFTTSSNNAPCAGTADGTFTYSGIGWTGTGTGGPAAFSIFEYGIPESISGDYQGTFDNGTALSQTGVGNSSVNITVQNNFSVQGSITVGTNNLCGRQTAPLTLSLQDPAAIANGIDPANNISSISSGDVVEIVAANSATGDLVFFALTGTGPDGVAQEPEGTMWATGTYVSGPACPAGTAFYDKPFQKIQTKNVFPLRPSLPTRVVSRHQTLWETKIQKIVRDAQERRAQEHQPQLHQTQTRRPETVRTLEIVLWR